MISSLHRLVAVFATLLVLASTAGATEFKDGAEAFNRKDYAAAVDAWQLVAERDDVKAQFGLGLIYEAGGGGVEQDYAAAALWYRKAAEQGLAQAQFNLGNLYRLGQGVDNDARVAVDWYARAASQGLAPAQYNLALSYETGNGAAQNYAVAAKWYRLAAEQGEVEAQIGLASLYRYGLGVAEDRDQAIAWYGKAAEQGDARAKYHLTILAPEAAGGDGDTVAVEPPAAKPATKPVDDAAPVPAVEPPPPSGFEVQIAALRSAANAEREWQRLSAAQPDLLGDLTPAVRSADLGEDKGMVYRLVVGPFASKAAARDRCAALKAQNIDCFVTRP